MEQETKSKKQPNLKRVILWTTLISVVATLVLYYFSYIFPIPAVEIDATGIPQTKEEYEQKLFKERISNLLGDKTKFDFGDKIIQLFDLDDYLNKNFGVVYLKSGQYWLFARFILYNRRIKADETKLVNFQIDGSEVIGYIGLDFANLYINKKNKNPQFLVFNKDKDKVYYYALDGKIEKMNYLSKDCKFGFDIYNSLPRFVLGKNIFIENDEYARTISSLKDWNSSDSCIINNLSRSFANEIFNISNNTIYRYDLLSDMSNNKIDSSVKYIGNYSEISFGLPILNSKDGVYFFDVKYSHDKKSNSFSWLPDFVRIMNEPISKETILYSDLYSVMFGKQIGDNYQVYYIDCRNYSGSYSDYGGREYKVLMWKFVVPGRFKWHSRFSNVFCTDKGFFAIPSLNKTLYMPYQMYFDYNQYESKFPYKLKNNAPLYIEEYPRVFLFGKGNYALSNMLNFFNAIYENMIKYIYSILALPLICIALFLLSRTEERKKPKNKQS